MSFYDEIDYEERPTWSKKCGCGATVERWRGQGDVDCPKCGQWYNAFGQQLRSDWMDNPAWSHDDIGDMEGFEQQHASAG